jgi:hypothetical protein
MEENYEDRGFRSIGSLVPKISSSLRTSDSTPTTQRQSSATTGAQNPALVASIGVPSGARTAGASLSGNGRDLAGDRPTRPSLTPRVRSLLVMSARSVYPEGSPPISIAHEDWQPPLADAALLAEADAQIGRLEYYLAPINKQRLLARISALLAQYYVAEIDLPADEMVLQMWVEALQRFPEWAVAEAISDWVARSRERPKIADIVLSCRALTGDAAVELHCLRRLVNPREQEQARARQAEAEAERQRAAEREAFLAANPDWTVGLPQHQPRERPMEPEPFDKGRYRAAIEQLKNFRLPDPDDPRVLNGCAGGRRRRPSMVNQEEERRLMNTTDLSRDLATKAGISLASAKEHVDIVFEEITHEIRNGGEVRMESKTDHD